MLGGGAPGLGGAARLSRFVVPSARRTRCTTGFSNASRWAAIFRDSSGRRSRSRSSASALNATPWPKPPGSASSGFWTDSRTGGQSCNLAFSKRTSRRSAVCNCSSAILFTSAGGNSIVSATDANKTSTTGMATSHTHTGGRFEGAVDIGHLQRIPKGTRRAHHATALDAPEWLRVPSAFLWHLLNILNSRDFAATDSWP